MAATTKTIYVEFNATVLKKRRKIKTTILLGISRSTIRRLFDDYSAAIVADRRREPEIERIFCSKNFELAEYGRNREKLGSCQSPENRF